MRTFIVCAILVFCCLLIACKGFAFRVVAESMLPAIKPGDTCIVDQYSSSPIVRFDIVMVSAPEELKKLYGDKDMKIISRIIGLPNEKIEIRENKIYIDEKLLDESFEKIVSEDDRKKNFPATTIPENGYFLLGDNRPNSHDSRYWKEVTIKKEDVLGKVVTILPIDVKK